jgi:hypothetical protein
MGQQLVQPQRQKVHVVVADIAVVVVVLELGPSKQLATLDNTVVLVVRPQLWVIELLPHYVLPLRFQAETSLDAKQL